MQRGRNCGETPRTFKRHVPFRVYLLHLEVRSMRKAFRMYLSHPDDDLSCSGPARVLNVAPFRIRLWYSNSVRSDLCAGSLGKQHMRMTLKPNSLKSKVGIRVRTPTPVTALWKRVTEVTALWRRVTGSDEGEYAVEGGEEYFDENEHVDGFAAEERSTDGEEVDESEGEDGLGPEGSAGHIMIRRLLMSR